MEKRTLLAIVLAILVLILWQYIVPQPPPKKVEKKIEKVIPKEGRPLIKEERSRPIGAIKEKEINVETALYRAILTNKGGVIKSWELKRYTDKNKRAVQLLRPRPEAQPEGVKASVLPLSILSEDEGLKEGILRGYYMVDADKVLLHKGKDKGKVTFTYQDAGGAVLIKTLTFYNNDYRIDLRVETEGMKGGYTLSMGEDFGIFNPEEGWAHVGPVCKVNRKKITDKPEKIKDSLTYKGDIAWTALEDKYFTAVLVPISKADEVIIKRTGGLVSTGLKGMFEDAEFLLYVGPKEYDRLKALKVSLEDIIDYGWFSFLARPLFSVLKFFYSFAKNYGIAIILLTAVIRIIFIPLMTKSQKSMKAMQALAPKINEIREKYKKDPQRMNREVMALYRKHKINPMGGCLPIILQIPIFIALYNVLMYAIELRGAPFYLWINDLSQKDPFYILPIAMGISMVIQQKMTPSTVDPMQSKIMMILPVVFTFMFLSFPSGLVLYWLMNNLLSIAQQYYINKRLK